MQCDLQEELCTWSWNNVLSVFPYQVICFWSLTKWCPMSVHCCGCFRGKGAWLSKLLIKLGNCFSELDVVRLERWFSQQGRSFLWGWWIYWSSEPWKASLTGSECCFNLDPFHLKKGITASDSPVLSYGRYCLKYCGWRIQLTAEMLHLNLCTRWDVWCSPRWNQMCSKQGKGSSAESQDVSCWFQRSAEYDSALLQGWVLWYWYARINHKEE